MLGKLNREQSLYILNQNHIGRIGCFAKGKVLVVPVTYVSDHENIYGHSLEGTKIDMMRENPDVCFEVDCVDNLANWRSVIVLGKFRELKHERDEQKSKLLFMERLLPLTLGETVSPYREMADPPHFVEKKRKPVLYKIEIEEITGRYEKQVFPYPH